MTPLIKVIGAHVELSRLKSTPYVQCKLVNLIVFLLMTLL